MITLRSKQCEPLTLIKKVQLELRPDESVTSYEMCVLPTSSFCGGRKPLSSRVSLELVLGTGSCHFKIAYDWPGSLGILSISDGHVMVAAWTVSVEKAVCLK